MKHTALFIIICALTTSLSSAQNNTVRKPTLPAPRDMALQRTDEMAKELSLTSAQKTAVLKLNREYGNMMRPQGGGQPPQGPMPNGGKQGPPPPPPGEQMKGPRPTDSKNNAQRPPMPNKAQMDKMRKEQDAQRSAYEKKLKAILSPSQYNVYIQKEKNRKPPVKRN